MFFLGNFNCQKIVFNIKRKSITLMAAAKKNILEGVIKEI